LAARFGDRCFAPLIPIIALVGLSPR